jgi:diguanylate cyclase (GGDEF)-like protein
VTLRPSIQRGEAPILPQRGGGERVRSQPADRRSRLLKQSADLATADVSAREAMRWGLDLVCADLGWPFGRVLIVDRAERELVSTGIWHDDAPERHRAFVEAFDEARFSEDVGLPGVVASEGRAVSTDVMDPRINPRGRELGIACALTFAVALPILSDQGVEGVIEAMGPNRVDVGEELLELFTHVGLQVGRVIERDRSRRLLRDAERLAELGPWSWDVERDELHCAPELFTLHGVQPRVAADGDGQFERTPREAWMALLPAAERRAIDAFSQRILATGRSDEIEYHVKRGRATRWLRLYAIVAERSGDRVVRVAGYAQDVTARHRTEERRRRAQLDLAREQRVLERIARGEPLEQTLSGLCRHIERQYPGALCSVLLLDRAAGVLRHGAGPSLPDGFSRVVDKVPVGDGVGGCGTAAARGEIVVVPDMTGDPTMVAYLGVAAEFGLESVWSHPLTKTSGEVIGTFAVYRDHRHTPSRAEIRDVRAAGNLASLAIERSRAEAALQTAANYDSLTQLPNRPRFLELVEQRLAETGRRVAVMFLEVDRFRLINDSLGHLIGERILVDVAERLRHTVGDDGIVARFGGNEFTVLLPDADEQTLEDVPDRAMRALETPIWLDGGEFFLAANLGIAIADGTVDAFSLVRDADAAMAAARARGPGRRQLYDRRLRARTIERLNRETELRRAIERGELVMRYQPVLDLKQRTWSHVEALVRWRHPSRGLLPPDEFIPLAEETGLIIPLGASVLEMVTAQAALWSATLPDVRIAANASVLQLADPSIASDVIAMLTASHLAPQTLMLEVTETALMEQLDAARAALAQLRSAGVGVMIDDFGTGYSSLARLGELPITGVKLDRRFTSGLGTDATMRRVLRAIAELAGAYGLDVVAEGIEDAGALADVDALGCRFAQGFYIGRPVPAAVVQVLLAGSPELDRF